MNWVCGQGKQYKKSLKTRQQEFFARRRQQKEKDKQRYEDQKRPLLDEEPIQPQSKFIRGSFDVFALVGKEELVSVRSWRDLNGSNCSEQLASSVVSPLWATLGSSHTDMETSNNDMLSASEAVDVDEKVGSSDQITD